jgi:tetratricopeptide (TPR) repeat protein
VEPVAWGWPVGILAAGLLIGSLLLWRMRRAAPEPPAGPAPLPLALRDLDARLESLLAQLRELDDLAGARTSEQLARERYALELEAAASLREREGAAAQLAPAKKAKGQAAAPAPALVVPTGPLASRPALRGFLYGVATAASIGALVFVVWRQAKPREQGGSLTGNVPMSGAGAVPVEPGDEASQLKAAIAQDPDDLEARLDLAQLHLRQRDLMGVWNETQYVLAKQPGQPRALAYQGLVRLAMGQPDVAVTMLKQAIATDPDMIEGYLHLALVYMRTGRTKDAEAIMKQAGQRFPTQALMLARVMQEMRTAAGSRPEGDPHAEVEARARKRPRPRPRRAGRGTRR